MTSYQRLKAKLAERDAEIGILKKELHAKGNIFFKEKNWLGRATYGTVINGKLIYYRVESEDHAFRKG